jgi:6-phosphogluconolactonase
VANYDDGSVGVLPAMKGTLVPAVQTIHHQGSSVNPERQKGPHAHGVVLDRGNRYLFVPDLGLDKIKIYHLQANGKLTEKDSATVAPGAGPRHFTFHPSGRWAYVINELNSTINTLKYNPASGVLAVGQTISTIPTSFSGKNYPAEIAVASDGRFVYGSNRGHDSIAVFAINEGNGTLSLVQHISTQGKWPRNFAIDPTGNFLLVANQNSDSVVTFRVDRKSGRLSETGHTIDIPAPVCVTMSDKL